MIGITLWDVSLRPGDFQVARRGQIGAGIDDRHFQFPFILKDLDLDLVDGDIRIRGNSGIGADKNMVLFTLASFDARVGLSPTNFHNRPYTDSQLGSLFDVSVMSTTVDAAPGTEENGLPQGGWGSHDLDSRLTMG